MLGGGGVLRVFGYLSYKKNDIWIGPKLKKHGKPTQLEIRVFSRFWGAPKINVLGHPESNPLICVFQTHWFSWNFLSMDSGAGIPDSRFPYGRLSTAYGRLSTAYGTLSTAYGFWWILLNFIHFQWFALRLGDFVEFPLMSLIFRYVWWFCWYFAWFCQLFNDF